MTELITKLQDEGNFLDAYLVAKNALSRNNGSIDAFNQFIEIALKIASYDIVFDERKQYVAEANAALDIFSESVEIDESVISLIKATRNRINETMQEILISEKAYMEEVAHKVQDENTQHLNKLVEIYNEIKLAKTQEEFEIALSHVTEVENLLNKDAFSPEQEASYEKLTQQFSQAISSQMDIINKNALFDYNKRAISCFNDVLVEYKKEPSKYKDESTLKALMTTKFFAFDTSKLFNESLVFYNHVYSLVFQEASDHLKYKLTEWALNTVKLEK